MTEEEVLIKLNQFKNAIITLKNKSSEQSNKITELENVLASKEAELLKSAEFSENVTNVINEIEGILV